MTGVCVCRVSLCKDRLIGRDSERERERMKKQKITMSMEIRAFKHRFHFIR